MRYVAHAMAGGMLVLLVGLFVFDQMQSHTPKWKASLGVPDTTYAAEAGMAYVFDSGTQRKVYVTRSFARISGELNMVAFEVSPRLPNTYKYRGFICPDSTYDHTECSRMLLE